MRPLASRLAGKEKRRIVLTSSWIDEVVAEASKKPEKIRDAAADVGTRAHAYIDSLINGTATLPPEQDIAPAVAAFMEWFVRENLRFICGDLKVASLQHGFGGS